MSVLLTRRAGSAQTEIVAVHPATGNSSPNSNGAQRAIRPTSRRVFCARSQGGVCVPAKSTAGDAWGAARLAGSVRPVCYPRIVRHPANSSAVADSKPNGVQRMNASHAAPAAPRKTVEIPLIYLAWLLSLASVHHSFTASEAATLRKAALRLSAEVGA